MSLTDLYRARWSCLLGVIGKAVYVGTEREDGKSASTISPTHGDICCKPGYHSTRSWSYHDLLPGILSGKHSSLFGVALCQVVLHTAQVRQISFFRLPREL